MVGIHNTYKYNVYMYIYICMYIWEEHLWNSWKCIHWIALEMSQFVHRNMDTHWHPNQSQVCVQGSNCSGFKIYHGLSWDIKLIWCVATCPQKTCPLCLQCPGIIPSFGFNLSWSLRRLTMGVCWRQGSFFVASDRFRRFYHTEHPTHRGFSGLKINWYMDVYGICIV